MEHNEKTLEQRLAANEKAILDLTHEYTELRQVLKVFEQDNSMALHAVHGLAEIQEIKKTLASYIDKRGAALKTFSMFKDSVDVRD